MKKFFTIVFLATFLISYSQNNNIQKSFLLRFYEEEILIVKDKQNKSIYDIDKLNIKIDTLAEYGANVVICKFVFGENRIKSLDENLNITYNSSSCRDYIMAYDVFNKTTYRLQGFNGNDLLFLIKDIRESAYNDLPVKKILTRLNRSGAGLDFLAIYKALQKLDFDADCLKVCSDGKPAHGKVTH